MNVGVLAHSFPRFPGDTHGPFVKHLSEAIARRGHRVDALIPYDDAIANDPDSPLQVSSFRYVWPDSAHRLGYSRTLRRDIRLAAVAYLQSPLYFALGERALRGLISRRGLDLVHAHWLLPNGFIAARACARPNIPFAVTLHGSDIFMAERNPLFRKMARFTLQRAAHVTSCSADLRNRLLALGGSEHAGKVHLVANGTDLAGGDTPAGNSRQRWGLPPDAPLLVAVGRLVDKKGFRFLLDALPQILESVPNAHLAIGGSGPLQEPLERQVQELGLEQQVSFTGGLSHPEVLALIAAGDLFVMPSVRDVKGNIDGLPIVVLEAMAAGKPVVATDIAGMPLAIEDGLSGRLVPEQDAAVLATAICDVLSDPSTAIEMGTRARQRVEEALHWDAIAAVHDELYQNARGQ